MFCRVFIVIWLFVVRTEEDLLNRFLLINSQDVFHERVKLYKIWKDAEAALAKKREERTKFEQQNKADKITAASLEIAEVCSCIKGPFCFITVVN
jgi:hypothetical protein